MSDRGSWPATAMATSSSPPATSRTGCAAPGARRSRRTPTWCSTPGCPASTTWVTAGCRAVTTTTTTTSPASAPHPPGGCGSTAPSASARTPSARTPPWIRASARPPRSRPLAASRWRTWARAGPACGRAATGSSSTARGWRAPVTTSSAAGSTSLAPGWAWTAGPSGRPPRQPGAPRRPGRAACGSPVAEEGRGALADLLGRYVAVERELDDVALQHGHDEAPSGGRVGAGREPALGRETLHELGDGGEQLAGRGQRELGQLLVPHGLGPHLQDDRAQPGQAPVAQLPDERGQNVRDAGGDVSAGGAVEDREHVGQRLRGDRPDEVGLAGEVPVDRARRESRRGEDVLHRRGVKPLPGEAAGGCVEDLLAAAFEVFLADLGHGS